MRFNNISMTKKLPAAFVVLTFVVILFITTMVSRDFKQVLDQVAVDKLGILAQERSKAITSWFNNLQQQISLAGIDPTIIKASQGFNATFGLTMDDPVAELHSAYIDENPNPKGSKDLLDRAPGAVPYNSMHEAFHPSLRTLKTTQDLYDVFIFDLKGNLVYSVFKEADFATNFEDGPYKNSGLGEAYAAAKADGTNTVHFVDFRPYAPSAGEPASFMATSIIDKNGVVLGVFAVQVPSGTITDIITNSDGLGRTTDVALIANDQRTRTDSRFDAGHKVYELIDFPDHIQTALAQKSGSYINRNSANGVLSIGFISAVNVLGQTWSLLAEIESSEVHEVVTAQHNKAAAFSATALVLIGLIGWVVSRSITRPLTSVVASMEKIGQRDYDIDLSGSSRGDEIGDLSRALEAMSKRSQEFDQKVEDEKIKGAEQDFAVTELGSALQELANGNLDFQLETHFSTDYEALRKDFNATVTNLKSTISELISFASMIEDQTTSMSADTSDLSLRTERQAATLEQTAATVDQITGNVQKSSGDLKTAEALISEVNIKAKISRKVVEETTGAMSKIETTSNEIQDIVRVVDDIAFQTNLLALNAGVEAARAGETGQGFAVVASEVRQLAQRTSEAVGQIKILIENSGNAVKTGVDLVGNTEKSLVEIVERIDCVSNLVTSVATTSKEQSESLGEVNVGVTQLDQATQQNAAMVDKSDAAAQALKSEANTLAQMLTKFKLGEVAKSMPPREIVATTEPQPIETKQSPRTANSYDKDINWEEWVA